MDEERASASSDAFQDLVRDALIHLYDTSYLQTHELARLLASKQPPGALLRGKLLLRTLLDAIELLRPPRGTPAGSTAWRTYQLLVYRYVEGLSVIDASAKLAISKTQFKRDHARALEAIALVVRDTLKLGETETPPVAEAEPRHALAVSEASWLADPTSPEYVDLVDLIQGLFVLLDPVCREARAHLSLEAMPNLTPVYADRVALRQIFLILLNAALEGGSGSSIAVSVSARGPWTEILVGVQRGSPENPAAPLPVEVLQGLAGAAGGRLDMQTDPAPPAPAWSARLSLPVARRPLILVIDNHPDFIALVRRYLAEYDWTVLGATDVQRARSLAAESRPDAILLDVMMPWQDGWDLLLALRERPETSRIPVVVCSVLYEPQVARALGAVAYLPKPISQATLLATLEPLRRDRSGPERVC